MSSRAAPVPDRGLRAVDTISPAAARRIAVTAQQLRGTAPPARLGRAALTRAVDRLGVLQIDSVNVLERAHRMPLFARLGAYPVDLLESLVWTPPAKAESRVLVECWAHEASMVPVELYPLVGHRARHWSQSLATRLQAEHPGLMAEVLALVGERGPMTAGQIEQALEAGAKGRPGWWEWSVTKKACEALFASGALGTAHRQGFQRHYDLIDKVLPAWVRARPTPEPAQAHRVLVERAARAHGIATVKDLADYYRMSTAQTRPAVLDLVEDGVLLPVTVTGTKDQWYLHTDAARPRTVSGAALLCPFDPLIWERSRTERLFDFHYRIEIYTPEPKRQFGYYVFPLLVGDRLVGRFDLKADRATGRLLVQASWQEHGPGGAAADGDVDAAADQLHRLAGWLGLGEIDVVARGNWAVEVGAAVRAQAS